MRIPVFGDIHGNIEGMFFALQQLQREHEEKYPFVLQVGDLGYFPTRDSEDYATRRHGKHSETEQGVRQYLAASSLYERFFHRPGDDALCAKIFFIRGNHEDRGALKKLEVARPEGAIAADPYGVLHYLPDGRGISIPLTPHDDLTIVGYGGIAKDHRPKACSKNPDIAFSELGLDRLVNYQPGAIDVLLTHQGPDMVDKGDVMITMLCESLKPKLHLHGHTHHYSRPVMIGETSSYCIGLMPATPRPGTSGFYGFLDGRKNFTLLASPVR
ncbi:MAG: metallophosphoesterase [Nanoarchaeota archaeon]